MFNMVMRYWLRPPSAVWTTTKIQNTSGYTGGGRGTADISHDFRKQLPDLGPEQNDAVGDDAKRDGQIAPLRPGVEDGRNATCVLEQRSGRNGLGVQHGWCRLQNTKSRKCW